MAAKYIIRMDDACSQMDKQQWDRIEKILDRYQIKPVVAVIPKNEDESLMVDEVDSNFWDQVTQWKNKGWTIALHGYNHVYGSKGKSIIPLKEKSEFSGLSLEAQRDKIKKGVRIFEENQITPDVFIAPGHAFDETTLKALKLESNISIISDGFFSRPVKYLDFKWIPQQIWQPRKMPIGTWTVCYHPNTMKSSDFDKLEYFLSQNSKDVITIDSITIFKKIGFIDYSFSILFNLMLRLKKYA